MWNLELTPRAKSRPQDELKTTETAIPFLLSLVTAVAIVATNTPVAPSTGKNRCFAEIHRSLRVDEKWTTQSPRMNSSE